MDKIEIPASAMKYFRITGAMGGRVRAAKHSKEELSEWGRKGGRPKNAGNRKGSEAKQ